LAHDDLQTTWPISVYMVGLAVITLVSVSQKGEARVSDASTSRVRIAAQHPPCLWNGSTLREQRNI
jgi:hypothetical protein